MRRGHERKGFARVSWDGGVEQDIPSDRGQAACQREQGGLKFHGPRMGRRAAVAVRWPEVDWKSGTQVVTWSLKSSALLVLQMGQVLGLCVLGPRMSRENAPPTWRARPNLTVLERLISFCRPFPILMHQWSDCASASMIVKPQYMLRTSSIAVEGPKGSPSTKPVLHVSLVWLPACSAIHDSGRSFTTSEDTPGRHDPLVLHGGSALHVVAVM